MSPSDTMNRCCRALLVAGHGLALAAFPALSHAQTGTAPAPAATPAQAPAAKGKAAAAPKPIKAIFVCEAGKTIDATFVNGAYPDVTLVLSDGRHITVPQTMSASGARYASSSGIFVFWNKGDTAVIEENGKPTFRGCKTKK
jgi:membrane-bound inhibitor of C-type lysozyme